jgi:outer membrane protein
MKNGLLIWNIILTMAIGYLLLAHFNSGKKDQASGHKTSQDTSVNSKQFRIAYFEMDSVAANAEMVKEVKTELNKKEDDITAEMDRRTKEMQQKFNYYQNLATSGNLTDAQNQAASQEIKTMDDELKNRKQQLDQEYTDLVTRRQNEIKSKIEGFLKDYNRDGRFSYIISYEQGLFYYKDSIYNITADLIKGLNEKYKSTKK